MPTLNVPCPRALTLRPPRVSIGLVLIAASMQLVLPINIHEEAALLASLAAAAGFAVMMRAWVLFKAQDTAICPTAPTRVLITTDIYRWTRNPMYLGITMMMTGVAIFSGSVYFYLAALVFFAMIDYSFCPYEEAKLLRHFGDQYSDYVRQTRRWL